MDLFDRTLLSLYLQINLFHEILSIYLLVISANAQIKADRGRLTDTEIERMIADAERYREEDEALAKKIHLRNALEESVYRIKSSLTEKNDIVGMTELDDILNWLETESDAASHDQIQKKCDQLYSKFGVRVDASGRKS
jgi:molecular chaperone DnaK (HSP70)